MIEKKPRPTSYPARPWLALLVATLMLNASPLQARPGDRPYTAEASPPTSSESQRQQLGYGYAMLYEATRQLGHINKALWLKRESESVRQVIDALAKTMRELGDSLEAVADVAPAINLKDQGLPVYEVKKRNSVYIERGLDVGTPLAGRTGHDFERVLLLSMSAAVNQQRHLAKVMIDDEPSAARRDWLKRAKAAFDDRYDAIVELLESDYFCDPKP